MGQHLPIHQPSEEILHIGRLHFLIKSESRKGIFYSVDLEDQQCECEAFQIQKLRPCKHYRKAMEHVIEAVNEFRQSAGGVHSDESGLLEPSVKG
jgi:hypothetical protein